MDRVTSDSKWGWGVVRGGGGRVTEKNFLSRGGGEGGEIPMAFSF